MPYVKKIKLFSQVIRYGDRREAIITKENQKEVFAEIYSAGAAEFFQASAGGFKPEGKALVWRFEYNGQSILELEGQRFAIYRTYWAPGSKKIELHFGYEIGPNTPGGATP